ncbi:MAG: stage II sporulation protein P [Clostridia bacterium]|nr:stage II sporulation protein P [Clostridia bacterium]
MKNGTLKDKHLEIFSYLISAALIAAVCIGGSAEKLSVAMASFMFYPVKPETTAVSETTVTQTEPVTVITTQKPTQLTAEEAEKPSDITETAADILALIKKYTELLADDKKGGEIQSVTYEKAGATHIFENVRVKNTTETKSLDIEKVLSKPLELSVDKSKPAVLIFHSHTSEGYEMIERDWFAQGYNARSNDENRNVVRVGTEIANYLTELGYTVIHDKTIHDKSYSDSYSKSRKTVAKHLEEHPEIQIVLDIHRDSMTQSNGDKIKPVNTIKGKKAAQLMIITGAEEGKVENFPDWEYNLRFALQLQKKCETMFPGLMRPVLFSQRKYNMDMTRFSLLIEMGSEANTLEEACYSGRMLAAALASLMDEYVKDEKE